MFSMKYRIFLTLFIISLMGCSEPLPEELFLYPEERGGVPVSVLELQAFDNFSRDGVTFPSKETTIAGNIYYPDSMDIAIAWIPAAGKTKEDAQDRGIAFASRGIAALVVDVRGLGQTSGAPLSLEQDAVLFAHEQEPYHHLVVYDALRAVDALRERGYTCVLLGGESNGGRIALLAAAQDKKIPGILLMSTAGFGNIEHPDPDVKNFLTSINPDAYAPYLKTPTAFIHDINDPTIPFSAAKETYNKIASSKTLFMLNKGCHGYCPTMNEALTQSIEFLKRYCPS